jgi:hypothetical protein
MTTNKTPFWTNTILDITKPELSITFNSYDLVYDTYTMDSTNNPPKQLPQNQIQNIPTIPLSPCKSYGNNCGYEKWFPTPVGGSTLCDPQDSANEDCPYDDPSCPDNYLKLGQRISGGNTCNDPCGGTCQNKQLTFCGVPKLKDSIFIQNNE